MSPLPWRRLLGHCADPLYRQSYYMLASTGVSAATGLLFWVLAAHRTSPDVLGVAAGLVAANAFLSYLTSFALPYAMLRFGGPTRPVSGLVNTSLAFSAATSMLAAAGFAMVAPVLSPALASQLRRPADVLLFGLAGVGAAAGVLLDNLLAARRRAVAVLVRNTAAGLAKPLLVLLVAADDPRSLYLAATLPTLLSALAVYMALPTLLPGVRLSEFRLDETARAARSFAVRAYAGSLLSGAPQFALPLIAVAVLVPREYAYFYMAWSIAQIVYLVPSVVANITLSQGPGVSNRDLVVRARRFSFVLIAPACLAGILSTELVLGLYGAAYVAGAAVPLRLMLMAAVPWTIVIIAQTQLRLEHRFLGVTVLTACFCVGSLGLPTALGAPLGVHGMAGGWLVAVVATAALAWWLTGRAVRQPPVTAVRGRSEC